MLHKQNDGKKIIHGMNRRARELGKMRLKRCGEEARVQGLVVLIMTITEDRLLPTFVRS